MSSPPACNRTPPPTANQFKMRCSPRRPRACNSAELLAQVEFTQKQIDMTKEALEAQEKRNKEEIKATEEETKKKNAEIEGMLGDVRELNNTVEKLTTEVHGKEAELVTLHTANQILSQHMREEIEELKECTQRERIAKEQLTPQLNDINAAICSIPDRSQDLSRQQEELLVEINSFKESPQACNLSDFMGFEEIPEVISFSPPQVQARNLDFVSPSRPGRDTPSPIRYNQGPSPRSPNYYTNLLLNPRPPTPPELPSYNVQQMVGANFTQLPRRPRSAGPPVRSIQPEIQPLPRSRTPPPSPPLPTLGGARTMGGQWYDEGNAGRLPSPPVPAVALSPPLPAQRVQAEAFPPPPALPSYDPAQWSVSPIGNQQAEQGMACALPQTSSPPIRTAYNANQFNSPPIQTAYNANQFNSPPIQTVNNSNQFNSSPIPIADNANQFNSPPIQTAYNANQFNSPPIRTAYNANQVGNEGNFYIPPPPPLPNYNIPQFDPSGVQEPIRRPLRPVPQMQANNLDQQVQRARSPSPVRPFTPPGQYPNYDVTLSPGNQTQGFQFRPPTPPPLPTYNVEQYAAEHARIHLRRNLRQPRQQQMNSPQNQSVNAAVIDDISRGANNISGYGIGEMSGGGFSFQEVQGYESPGLMGMSTPTTQRTPRDRDAAGSGSPLTSGGCCAGGNRGGSPPPSGRRNYNQAELSACPVGPNVDGYCPCTQMALGQRDEGIGGVSPPPFNDLSFPQNNGSPFRRSPPQNGESPFPLITPPGMGVRNVTDISFQDMSFQSPQQRPQTPPSFVYNRYAGINEQSFNMDNQNLSFSPIQMRQQQQAGIGDISAPNFQDISFNESLPGGYGNPLAASTPNSCAWALDGIQEQDINFDGNLSFSPIQLERRGPARRINDITPPSFRDMSFGTPRGQEPSRSGPGLDMWGMDGIQGQSFDFNANAGNMSFSPIQVNGRGVGAHLQDLSPPTFQDMSFASGIGLTPPAPTNQSGCGRRIWDLDGIQDQSLNFGTGADMSFSPIQPRGSPARRLDDVSPPGNFRDISLPSGIGTGRSSPVFQYGGALTLADRRGDFGIVDESFDLNQAGADLSFSTPVRPTTPVSPFATQNGRTPPVGSPDLFQFSPTIQMTPPSGGACARNVRPTTPPQPIDLRRQLPPNFNPTNQNLMYFSPTLSPDGQANQQNMRQRSASPQPSSRVPIRDLRYELTAQPEAIYQFRNAGADLNAYSTPPQNRVEQSPPNLMGFSPDQSNFMEFSPVADMIQFSPSPNRNSPSSCARTR